MADSQSFELAASQLERRTDLDRLSARGTLRIAMKTVHFDARTIDAKQMIMVVERILPEELAARGIERAESVCAQVTAVLEDLEDRGEEVQSPDAIFKRLVRR